MLARLPFTLLAGRRSAANGPPTTRPRTPYLASSTVAPRLDLLDSPHPGWWFPQATVLQHAGGVTSARLSPLLPGVRPVAREPCAHASPSSPPHTPSASIRGSVRLASVKLARARVCVRSRSQTAPAPASVRSQSCRVVGLQTKPARRVGSSQWTAGETRPLVGRSSGAEDANVAGTPRGAVNWSMRASEDRRVQGAGLRVVETREECRRERELWRRRQSADPTAALCRYSAPLMAQPGYASGKRL